MLKEQIQTYKKRWKLIAEAENREIREAPPELLLKFHTPRSLTAYNLGIRLNAAP